MIIPSREADLDLEQILPWSLGDTQHRYDTGSLELGDILHVDSLCPVNEYICGTRAVGSGFWQKERKITYVRLELVDGLDFSNDQSVVNLTS